MGMLEDMGTLLQSAGIATLGTDLFIGRMPEDPTTAIAIQTYSGSQPTYVHERRDPAYEEPRFQVMVRAPTYTVAEAKAQACWERLCTVRNDGINGNRYLRVTPLQSPFAIPEDANDRVRFACNYEVMKAR